MSEGSAKALVYSAVGACVGLFLFLRSFRTFKEAKLIANTPTSKIRSLAMGRVEVYGKVELNTSETLIAPFSGKRCAYCRWTIEEYRSSGKSSHWVTVRKGTEGRYFYVNDGTGRVLVDYHGARVDIPSDERSRKLSPQAKRFMTDIKYNYKSFIFNKSLRITEWRLDANDKLYIMGTAGDNPFIEDGTSTKNEGDIMIQKKGSAFFYMSDRPEKEILKSFRWKSYGGLLGGAALTLVCLGIIFGVLGIL